MPSEPSAGANLKLKNGWVEINRVEKAYQDIGEKKRT
jgi:hypothetical protein